LPELYDYLRFFAGFGIVVVLLYGVYYYFARLSSLPFGLKLRSKEGRIQVVETRVIGKNRYLLLVEVDGRHLLLLASDEEGIHLLQRWEREEQ